MPKSILIDPNEVRKSGVLKLNDIIVVQGRYRVHLSKNKFS